MKPSDLPERWKKRLRLHLVEKCGGRGELLVDDFRQNVYLTFEDGSVAFFRDALYLSEENEVAVFTEHCGYHVFPLEGTIVVELIEKVTDGRD